MVTQLFPAHIRSATATFRGKRLIGPIDLYLDAEKTYVVLGPNGAGKTTLLRALHGLARLSSGSINWACPNKEAQSAQAFVFQRPILLRRSALDNIAYPLRLRGLSKQEAQIEAQTWAAQVGLSNVLHTQAPFLSGGEQQKLSLARALISNPQLVLLDEPSASLDGRATREIEDILQRAKTAGTSLILSTHDIGQARRLADHVIFMLAGRVHETTPAAEFFGTPATDEARAFLRGDIVEC